MNTIDEYINKFREIQSLFIDFINDEGEREVCFQKFIQELNEFKIQDNKHDFKIMLNILVKISDNYHRSPYFFTKIFSILNYFKDKIINYFNNYEIFIIFNMNKRILLFLVKNGFIIIDENIANIILKEPKYLESDYHLYFAPELKKIINQDAYQIELPEDFDIKREEGENESYLCQIIRKDLIDDFISYTNRINLNLNAKIKNSIFETNSFLINKRPTILINKRPTIIEYAAFFGSIRIFQYLLNNKITFQRELW